MVSQSESDNYDIGLHIATAARILAVNPRNYVITPGPKPEGLDDWVTHIFSDPNLLRSLLVDQFCESQQALIWPNDTTDVRKVTIDAQEVFRIQDKIDIGLLNLYGNSRPSPYNPKYNGPAAKVFSNKPNLWTHLGSSQFFNAGITLLERFMESPDHFSKKEWPLSPLITAFPFILNFFRNDSNPAYKLPNRNLSEYREKITKYTSQQDRSIQLQIQTPFIFDMLNFQFSGTEEKWHEHITRLQNFKNLKFWLDEDINSLWIMCYLDFEIERTCNFGDNIDPEEWVEILDLCDSMVDKYAASPDEWLNSNFGVWGIGSARGSEGPIDDRFYWAWRTGYVIASGAHLLQNPIPDTETKSNILEDFPSRPLALDLVTSIGNDRDWESLRELLVEGLSEIRNGPELWDDGTYGVTYYLTEPEPVILNTCGSGSALSWMVKIGYVDGMYARKIAVPPNPYTDRANARSEPASNLPIEIMEVIESSKEIPRYSSQYSEQIQQSETTKNKPEGEYEEGVKRTIGETLWSKIHPDAQLEILLAEKLFQERDTPRWYDVASQMWCNASEKILSNWLDSKIYRFKELHQIDADMPSLIGSWSRYFKHHVIRLSHIPNPAWPELDLIKGKQLEDICRALNKGRKLAHHDPRKNVEVYKTRELFFGTLIDTEERGDSPGLLEVASALSGNNR